MTCSGGKSLVSGVIAAVFVLALPTTVAAAGAASQHPTRASYSSPAAAPAGTVTPTAFETATLKKINTYRAHRGLPALGVNDNLYHLSKQHSRDMAATNQLSHDGFYDRYLRSGFGTCVENVAWNYPTPASLVDAWKSSPGHNANLLDSRIRYAGMTRVGAYATFFACG